MDAASGCFAKLVQKLLPAVPWGDHVEMEKKTKVPAARLYYLQATTRFGWSGNVLLNYTESGAHERAAMEQTTHNIPPDPAASFTEFWRRPIWSPA